MVPASQGTIAVKEFTYKREIVTHIFFQQTRTLLIGVLTTQKINFCFRINPQTRVRRSTELLTSWRLFIVLQKYLTAQGLRAPFMPAYLSIACRIFCILTRRSIDFEF